MTCEGVTVVLGPFLRQTGRCGSDGGVATEGRRRKSAGEGEGEKKKRKENASPSFSVNQLYVIRPQSAKVPWGFRIAEALYCERLVHIRAGLMHDDIKETDRHQ